MRKEQKNKMMSDSPGKNSSQVKINLSVLQHLLHTPEQKKRRKAYEKMTSPPQVIVHSSLFSVLWHLLPTSVSVMACVPGHASRGETLCLVLEGTLPGCPGLRASEKTPPLFLAPCFLLWPLCALDQNAVIRFVLHPERPFAPRVRGGRWHLRRL